MSERQGGDTPRTGGLYAELKRRNVFRVAAAYIVIGWLTLQVADVVLGFTGAPEWVGKTLIALLLLGFVPALGLAWVFEVDRRGIHVDDGHADPGPTAAHASRLDTLTLIAVFFVVVLMAWQHLSPALRNASPDAATPSSTTAPSSQDESDAQATSRQPSAVEPLQADPGSIAVLPFTNRSAEPDTAYFVDGVHDDLLTELSRNAALTVISRTSVLEYRDTTKNLRQIGEELGVAHVLEGAVQRAGQRVRINAQLIDARSDKHLWAETFDRELKPESIFEIQSEIATAIATALSQKLGVDQSIASTTGTQPPTRDPIAYEAYLRARVDRESWDIESIETRMKLYHQAVEADPEFALALAELSREYANRFWFHDRRIDDRRESRIWIDRALALNPDDPQVRLALAEYHYRAELDWEASLAELDRAEQGLPGSAEIAAMRGYIHRRLGQPDEALAGLLRAARLDPRSWTAAQGLFEMYLLIGRIPEGRHWGSIVSELPGVPEVFRRIYFEEQLARRTGDPKSALAELDRLAALNITDSEDGLERSGRSMAYLARAWPRLARYLAMSTRDPFVNQFRLETRAVWRARMARAQGDEAASRRHAEQARVQLEALLASDPDDYRTWMEMAHAEALIGSRDGTRAAIERALAHPTVKHDALIYSEVRAGVVFALAPVADGDELAEALGAYLALPMRYASFEGLMAYPEFDKHRDHPAIRALAAKYAREDDPA